MGEAMTRRRLLRAATLAVVGDPTTDANIRAALAKGADVDAGQVVSVESPTFNGSRPPHRRFSPHTVLLDRDEQDAFADASKMFSDTVPSGLVEEARREFHRYTLGVGITVLGRPGFGAEFARYTEEAAKLGQQVDIKVFAALVVEMGLKALNILHEARAKREAAVLVPDRPLILSPEEARREAEA